MKYVAEKNHKPFAADLKTIYWSASEQKGLDARKHVTEKWKSKYSHAMKSWETNWDVLYPIFKFSADVRKVI